MRRLLLVLPLLGFLAFGCEQPVASFGIDLGDAFPQRADWYWKYNNDDFAEVSYWQNLGTTAPDGEEWVTFRIWVALEQAEFIPDLVDGDPSDWDLQIYFVERSGGWWMMGWEANPNGDYDGLGTEYFDGDGVPFALGDVISGRVWESESSGRSWSNTVTRLEGTLEFNGQVLQDVWVLEIASDAGDTPIEGTWWVASGPGIVQWDLPPFRAEVDEPNLWQHMHNDSWDNVLGSSD